MIKMVTSVREIMSTDLAKVSPSTTALEAAKLMRQKKTAFVLVVEQERLLGIITEKDFLDKVIAQERNPTVLKAHEFMSKPVIAVAPETDVADAAALMSKHTIRKLGVLEGEKVLGVVTAQDLVRNLSRYVSRVFSEHFYTQ